MAAASLATAPAAQAANLYVRFELGVERLAINTGSDAGSTVNGADAQLRSFADRRQQDHDSQWLMSYENGDFGHVELRNRWSQQCLDVEGTGHGARLEQQPCDDTTSQRWTIKSDGSGQDRYYLVNTWASLAQGKDMIATSFGTTPASEVRLWSNYAGADQIWATTEVRST